VRILPEDAKPPNEVDLHHGQARQQRADHEEGLAAFSSRDAGHVDAEKAGDKTERQEDGGYNRQEQHVAVHRLGALVRELIMDNLRAVADRVEFLTEVCHPRGGLSQAASVAFGQTAGNDQASATSRGTGGESQETGNAAASNYPGEVMRKLARVRRPSSSARGVAVVAFHVADNGALAGVTIARSSGSPQLDQAALAIVQGAAPFPPPPQGAQRSFSIDIVGR
jgi:TonB family protein